MNDSQKEFLIELHGILSKYNADITLTFDPCSDTHGMYDEAMSISVDNGTELRIAEGYNLNSVDIEEFIKQAKGEKKYGKNAILSECSHCGNLALPEKVFDLEKIALKEKELGSYYSVCSDCLDEHEESSYWDTWLQTKEF